jgi:hypothetical protein
MEIFKENLIVLHGQIEKMIYKIRKKHEDPIKGWREFFCLFLYFKSVFNKFKFFDFFTLN